MGEKTEILKPEEYPLVNAAKELGGVVTSVTPEEIPGETNEKGLLVEEVAGQKQYIDEDGTRYDEEGNVILQGSKEETE